MKKRVLAGALAAFVLGGCGGGSGTPPAPSAGAGRAAYAEAAQCMRDNGFPDFPDPVETNGRWGFPPSVTDLVKQSPGQCRDLFVKAGSLPDRTRRAVSGEEMTKLRAWGECLRGNGLPDWPDPDAEGVFHPQQAPQEDDPAWQKADEACRSLEPGPISVDAGNTAAKNGR